MPDVFISSQERLAINMRIAIAYDLIYPFTMGGAERMVHEIAVHLGKKHEVHLFSIKFWDGGNSYEIAPNVYAHAVCKPMSSQSRTQATSHNLLPTLIYSLALTRALLKHGPFDVVDCVSIPYMPMYGAKLACMLSGTPLVSLWLEVWRGPHWREHFGRVMGTVGQILEYGARHLPCKFLAISKYTRDALLEAGVKPDGVELVQPGIDWKAIQAVPAFDGSWDLLYVGRLIKDKQVALLIEAVALVREHFPEVRCRIIGEGPERQKLEEMVKSLQLESNVSFAGRAEDVYGEMKISKIMVHPSRREGFGIVLIEAAACGTPVVTINASDNASKDLVYSGKFGIVCDRITLVQAVSELLSDQARRETMGRAGKEWSRSFDWEQTARCAGEVYLNASKRRRND